MFSPHPDSSWASRRGPASLLVPVAAGPGRPEWTAAPRIPRTVQGVLSNAAGRPNGVGLLGRKWTVGPFLMRFPGGASFGARGRLAFRHRGAHRHRAARARHGEFGDFAEPRLRPLVERFGAMLLEIPVFNAVYGII